MVVVVAVDAAATDVALGGSMLQLVSKLSLVVLLLVLLLLSPNASNMPA